MATTSIITSTAPTTTTAASTAARHVSLTALLVTFLISSSNAADSLQAFCDGSPVTYAACSMLADCNARNNNVPNPIYCNTDNLTSHLCNIDNVSDNVCEGVAAEKNALELVPSSLEMQRLNDEMCGTHRMSGCDLCPPAEDKEKLLEGCDAMEKYTNLCREMPIMRRCNLWKDMCPNMGFWSLYCSSSGQREEKPISSPGLTDPPPPDARKPFQAPAMNMFFHTDPHVAVLFYSFTPQNQVQYWGYWFAVVAFTVGAFLFRHFRAITVKNFFFYSETPRGPRVIEVLHIVHALLRGVEFLWFYMLMLISMTYNVGLFFALGVGAVIGTVIVERLLLKTGLEENKIRLGSAEHGGDVCCG